MGSGEFDGGGSVRWTIEQDDGEILEVDPRRGRGIDKHPMRGTGGTFVVKLNGKKKFTADTDTSIIRVEWNVPTIAGATRAASSKAAVKASASTRSKAKKASKGARRRSASK
jgi:hypothetical protein